MQYQCFYLSENYKLAHEDGAEVLFETDNLGEACGFIHSKYREEGRDIAVYQPRLQGYRDYYRKPARDAKGRYTKR
jgi:hypothetical protein